MKGLTATAMAYAMSFDGVREHYTGKLLDEVNKHMNKALEYPKPGSSSIEVWIGSFTGQVLSLCGLEALEKMKQEVDEELTQKGFGVVWSYDDGTEFYRPEASHAPNAIKVVW